MSRQILFWLAFLWFATSPVLAQKVVATLTSAKGKVEVQRAGSKAWISLEVGDTLQEGDSVRTSRQGRGQVTFRDRVESMDAGPSVLNLDRNTSIKIEKFSLQKSEGSPQRTGLVQMLKGALYAITKGWRNKSVFSVRFGTSVCGIRGSSAHIEAIGNAIKITPLSGDVFWMDLPPSALAADVGRIANFIQVNQTKIPALNVGQGRSEQIRVQPTRNNSEAPKVRRIQVDTKTFENLKTKTMEIELGSVEEALGELGIEETEDGFIIRDEDGTAVPLEAVEEVLDEFLDFLPGDDSGPGVGGDIPIGDAILEQVFLDLINDEILSEGGLDEEDLLGFDLEDDGDGGPTIFDILDELFDDPEGDGGEGLPGFFFPDSDGDGIPDGFADTNGDGFPDELLDLDMDGIPDLFADNDGDGVPDIFADANGDGIPDLFTDFDGDGIPDLFPDFNGDGFPDEIPDSDGDGIPDGMIDMDGDGFPDGFLDEDGDGIPDLFADDEGDVGGCNSEPCSPGF